MTGTNAFNRPVTDFDTKLKRSIKMFSISLFYMVQTSLSSNKMGNFSVKCFVIKTDCLNENGT